MEGQGRLSLESGKVPLDEVTICSCQPHKIKKEINQEFEDVWKEMVVGAGGNSRQRMARPGDLRSEIWGAGWVRDGEGSLCMEPGVYLPGQ